MKHVIMNAWSVSAVYLFWTFLVKYLKIDDLEGPVFHQADSTVVSQDSLPVLFPLDAGDGVAHDVAV